MSRVLDTNIVLYHLSGRLAEPLPSDRYSVSVISVIEALSYPRIDEAERNDILDFLNHVDVVDVSMAIALDSARLRRTHHLKTPDAIIAATALSLGAELVTNDRDFEGVSDLRTSGAALKA